MQGQCYHPVSCFAINVPKSVLYPVSGVESTSFVNSHLCPVWNACRVDLICFISLKLTPVYGVECMQGQFNLFHHYLLPLLQWCFVDGEVHGWKYSSTFPM